LNNVLAKFEALDRGCEEAVILNKEGLVAECTADNIFCVRKGTLCTPQTSSGALEGITREVVIETAGKMDIPVFAGALTLYDLYSAEECFLSGTAAEIVPVVKIDGRKVGSGLPGKYTHALHRGFLEEIDNYCRQKRETVRQEVPVG
jgi:branched-chain amino acid aminotransferase